MQRLSPRLSRFSVFAWLVLLYNLAVILWGAFVRATGSGAGCGGHWPDCNGQVIPPSPQLQTLIEYAHRVTSGLSVTLIGVLVVWAFLAYGRGHRVRAGAVASALFILTEALLGAALVIFGWVATNDSFARAVAVSLHLVNTFILLAVLALTAWWASGGPAVGLQGVRARRGLAAALGLGLVGVAAIGITGAITALGDTLFPAGSLSAGLLQDTSPTASFLIRLRVIHPLIAVSVGVYLLTLLSQMEVRPGAAGRFSWAVRILVLIQLGAGFVNVILLAPIAMQLLHLLLADAVWISLVLFSASVFGVEHESARQGILTGLGQNPDGVLTPPY